MIMSMKGAVERGPIPASIPIVGWVSTSAYVTDRWFLEKDQSGDLH
jgi:hypothetical protein